MKWRLEPISAFERHAGDWDRLNNARGGSVLQGGAFITPLLREFAQGDERLAIGSDAGGIQVMTIVRQDRRGAWSTFQPSQAPIGLWVQAAGLDMVELAASLVPALPGAALLLGIQQMDPDLRERPATNGRTATQDYIQTARVTLDGSFHDYWAKRGKNLRQNMKKQANRLEREGMATRLERITNPAQVPAAIADYGRLESAGWKSDTGTAVHPDNAQGRFYTALLADFITAGRGAIYRYWYGDTVVAMDLCIEGAEEMIILKTTYDESIRDTSPAFLMRYEYFPQLFAEARLKRIEFYGKLMEWHTRWSDEVRTLYHVNVYRWGFLPKLRDMLKRNRPAADTPAENLSDAS